MIRTRKYKATTNSSHKFNIAPNWLDRNFAAERPNQKWAADISYIKTCEGWRYLAVVIDLHSRRVVGWAVSNRLKHDLALRALNNVVALRSPPPGCIHHMDRGSQYCSHDYQKRLRLLDFKVSPLSGAFRNALENAWSKSQLCAEAVIIALSDDLCSSVLGLFVAIRAKADPERIRNAAMQSQSYLESV